MTLDSIKEDTKWRRCRRAELLVKAEHIAQTRRDRTAARRTRQTSERGIFLPHSGQISSRFGQAAA